MCIDYRILLEVNRFDRGRLEEQRDGQRRLRPTAFIPGDLPIPCEVCYAYINLAFSGILSFGFGSKKFVSTAYDL